MKIYKLLLLLSLVFISCKKEPKEPQQNAVLEAPTLEKGEALFQQNNCAACHQIDQKVVGPSLQEIAKIYKEKNGSIVSFLKEEAKPIVDEAMYESMKINLQITKNMSNEELQSLEMYIADQAK